MNLQEKFISRSKWKIHGSNTVHHESVNVENENLHQLGEYFESHPWMKYPPFQ